MPAKVDYDEVRKQFSIEQVAALLSLDGKKRGEQIRCKCPVTDSGELVITPSKGAFYCFSTRCKCGGGQIELYSHVRQLPFHEAAVELSKVITRGGLQPLDYLLHRHDAVQALGITEEQALELGCGYAPRGTMIGRVCFEIRGANGELRCYLGYGEHLRPRLKIGRMR